MRIINLIPSFIKPILRLFRTKGMRLYRKWTFHPKSRDELHQYWKQPWDNMNLPQGYLKHEARSLFLVDITKKYASSSASTILEIGCNVGRNLEYLYRFGFRQLSGIEISESALQLLRQSYPDMSSCATIYNSPVENVIRDFNDGQFDIVFTMAVLEHIHPESEWVFPEIARITQSPSMRIEIYKLRVNLYRQIIKIFSLFQSVSPE